MDSSSKAVSYTSRFLNNVFLWMATALVITGVCAYGIAGSPALLKFFVGNQIMFFVLIIAQLGLAVYLGGWIERMSYQSALISLISFAAINGITLSSIFMVYQFGSIVTTFFVAAAMFLSMALYGIVTRRDLTGMGNVVIMMLFGVIIATLVNLFLKSAAFDFLLSIIGVVIFALLTAYDMQRLHVLAESVRHADPADSMIGKLAIVGALTLYLDFINMFLFLLKFFGNKRQD